MAKENQLVESAYSHVESKRDIGPNAVRSHFRHRTMNARTTVIDSQTMTPSSRSENRDYCICLDSKIRQGFMYQLRLWQHMKCKLNTDDFFYRQFRNKSLLRKIVQQNICSLSFFRLLQSLSLSSLCAYALSPAQGA